MLCGSFMLGFYDLLFVVMYGRARWYAIFMLSAGLAIVMMRWIGGRRTEIVRFCRRRARLAVVIVVALPIGIEGARWAGERWVLAQLPSASSDLPNVVVLVVDTLRADRLSCYGYDRPTSPAIDRIAHEGTLFENGISPSSWTRPSHSSLLTGRYTHEHHAEMQRLDGFYPTIAEAMSRSGYRTGGFSANTTFFTALQGHARGFLHFEDVFYGVTEGIGRTVLGRMFELYVRRPSMAARFALRKTAADVNEEMFRWVDRTPDRPFFAFLNYIDVHDPYIVPEPFQSRFVDPHRAAKDRVAASSDHYDGCISYVDEQIDRLVRGLQQRQSAAGTLLVITADHGEFLGEHGLLFHGTGLYREVIHVPLLIHWPGHVRSDLKVSRPVSINAVAATLLHMVKSPAARRFPGPLLSSAWEDPAQMATWPNPLSELSKIELQLGECPAKHGMMKCLMTPKWHYIWHERFGGELYDWQEDPQELHNLAKDASHGDECQKLHQELEDRVPAWTSAGNVENGPAEK
jgi:arylsulfatase A-like enzyme